MRSIIQNFILFVMLSTGCNSGHQIRFIPDDIVSHYVELFNHNDEELYAQYVPNREAAGFLISQIPRFECPDKRLEEIYYFRWWTFRKHIKKTPEGFIVSEFLPEVSWSGKYNAISCPALFHFNEGRWLRNQLYMNDYTEFWLRKGGSLRTYSFPIAHALYGYYLVTGNDSIVKELYPDLVQNFKAWENERFDELKGLFWQYEGQDGMEVSVCGDGYRATINSYMSAEAKTLSQIASLLRLEQDALSFQNRSEQLRTNLLTLLWDPDATFFKVLPLESPMLCQTRELHGYTPWSFGLAEKEQVGAWKYLMDSAYFFAPFGPTTAERCSPGFQVSYEGHECQWNGPSWPYATSMTLMGMANLLSDKKQSQDYVTKEDYFKLLKIFTESHRMTKDDGTIVPWIDENLNPFTGDWISRTRLKTWEHGTWSEEKGGRERGKDYNHSSYCDLIISGLIGIHPQEGNELVVDPLLPEGLWDYFCLEDIFYHGKNITVLYDKTGVKYNKGKGLIIFVNGEKKASSPGLEILTCEL